MNKEFKRGYKKALDDVDRIIKESLTSRPIKFEKSLFKKRLDKLKDGVQ